MLGTSVGVHTARKVFGSGWLLALTGLSGWHAGVAQVSLPHTAEGSNHTVQVWDGSTPGLSCACCVGSPAHRQVCHTLHSNFSV